jgi:hemolysin activation/secretion protein
MRLTVFHRFPQCHPWNYGDVASPAGARRHFSLGKPALASLLMALSAVMSGPARAQQASQPGFDPRQTEKRFDALQSGQTQPARPALRMPVLSGPAVSAGTRPLFLLRGISLTGAHAIPRDQIIKAYQPYLGKKVSQADLAAIAATISDLYRVAGFHLSRAIVPPQDIADGRVRLQVIEGSITEVVLTGDSAERFGVRSLLDPVLAETPSRLATLERQLLLINGRPGVRIADTALEEMGGASGRFRLIVDV